MKSSIKTFAVSISLLIFFIAVPCKALDEDLIKLIYKTVKRPSIASEQIKSATEFYIRPIDFCSLNPSEIGYKSQKEWEDESKGLPKEFEDAFLFILQKYNITNKKIVMLGRDEDIKKGIIVNTSVIKINNEGNMFIGERLVKFLCNINFTDADTGDTRFSGIANVTSRKLFFGANSAQQYGHFIYNLHSATHNTAFVLTRIMIDGNLRKCGDENCQEVTP
jgi:hypothetical protein